MVTFLKSPYLSEITTDIFVDKIESQGETKTERARDIRKEKFIDVS